MKFSNNEKNPQSFADESQSFNEYQNEEKKSFSNEINQKTDERLLVEEIPDNDKNIKGKNYKDGSKNVKQITQYLSTVVVTITVAVTAGVSYLTAKPPVNLVAEAISYNNYSCLLQLDELPDNQLIAQLTDKSGKEIISQITLNTHLFNSSENADSSSTGDLIVPTDSSYDSTYDSSTGLPVDSSIQDQFVSVGNGDYEEIIEKISASDGVNGNHAIIFGNLYPETDYKLFLREYSEEDGVGEEDLFVREFTTESFFTLSKAEENKISIELNPDFYNDSSLGIDFHLELKDSQGKDFSSNLYFYIYEESYFLTDGLYSGDYYLSAISYYDEEEIRYDKLITIQGLEPLEFNVEVFPDYIELTHLSGDLSFYPTFEISLSNDENYYSFYGEDVVNENGVITVYLTQTVASGRYELILLGIYESEENYLINDIFMTVVDVQ